jgi:predicted lipoprotein with Yx(FWY)xxD motif
MKQIIGLMIALLMFGTGVAEANHHAVKVAEKAEIGKYLTDTEGMTLYAFMNDHPGMSTCSGACIDKWPIFFREKIATTGGLNAEEFGTIDREDGQKQTTFRGFPLYYWQGDSKAGETKGQGIKNVWFVIDPDKFPMMPMRPMDPLMH